MANYTPIMNLLKPLESDKYDVNLRNDNWQKIDDFFGRLQNSLKDHRELNELDHPDACVTTRKLKDESVTTPKLADKSVTADKLSDDINTKLDDSYVKKSGDTMTGDLDIATSAIIKIQRKAGGGYHTINDGGADNGETNLDIGNTQYTRSTSLCCYNRPGWYGKNKTKEFRPLLTIPDISITYGSARDGQTLPIPEGFTEDECQWLLSVNQSNVERYYLDVDEGNPRNMINLECWREGRKVHVGTRLIGTQGVSKSWNGVAEKGRYGEETFIPGVANYICIAVKKA